jgi:hypothetical protein
MNNIFVLVAFLLSLTIYGQDFKPVTQKMLQCAEGDEEYLILKTSSQNDSFQWIWPTDICETVLNKINENFSSEEGFLFWINGQKNILPVKQSYYQLLPQGIYFENHSGKKRCIIEFILVSHIAASGYNYLVIDYSDAKKMITKEINSKTKIPLVALIPKK